MVKKKVVRDLENFFSNVSMQSTKPSTDFELIELDGNFWFQEKVKCKKNKGGF